MLNSLNKALLQLRGGKKSRINRVMISKTEDKRIVTERNYHTLNIDENTFHNVTLLEEKQTTISKNDTIGHGHVWYCSMCHSAIKEGTIRFTNTNRNGIDLCKVCHDKCVCGNLQQEPCDKDREQQVNMFVKEREFYVSQTEHFTQIRERIISADRVNSTLFRAFIEYSQYPCFGVIDEKDPDGPYKWLRYEQVIHRICCIAIGLEKVLKDIPVTVGNRHYISICGRNNLNWFLCDYACIFNSVITAPIHYGHTMDEMSHVVEITESKVVICTIEMLERYVKIGEKMGGLTIIVMDAQRKAIDEQVHNSLPDTVNVIPLSEIIENGKEILCTHLNERNEPKQNQYESHDENASFLENEKYDPRKMWIGLEHEDFILKRLKDEEDVLFLVFTSGSTGQPKGVMISDTKFRGELQTYRSLRPKIQFTFCPLAHFGDRKHTMFGIVDGAKIGIFTRDFSHIFEDIQKCGPTILSSTPRLYNVLFDEYKKFYELERIKWLSGRSVEYSSETELESAVMKEFRKILGGRIQVIVIGGAFSSPHIHEFLTKCFNCMVVDGFGMTEAGGIMANNQIKSTVDYKIVDVPDMNYFTSDKPYPRGKLCVKTKTMFKGYFKNEELTKASVDEQGWLCTDDIVEEIGHRQIRVIDRLKNIFKLSQGEFIAPAKIENVLTSSKFISQAFVYGTIQKSYLIAVIVPNETLLKQHALEKGIISHTPGSNLNARERELISKNKEIKQAIAEDIERVAHRESLLSYEIPKDFIIDFVPFSESNNLLTSSMKLKRFECELEYRERLNEMYNEMDNLLRNELDESFIRDLLIRSSTGKENYHLKAIDSLHAIKFKGIMKQKFHIEIPLDVIFSQTDMNVESVVDRIHNYVSQGKKVSTQNRDWKKEISLPKPLVQEICKLTRRQMCLKPFSNLKRGILLTGSTGFLGSFLLRDLIDKLETVSDYVKIYCLTRIDSGDKSKDRIRNHLKRLNIWKDSYERRIVTIVGDLEKPMFGMSNKDFLHLSQNIELIYHNGANVNSVLSYPQLMASNTISTLEILKFACLSSNSNSNSSENYLTPIIYVSTMGVVESGLSHLGFPTTVKSNQEHLVLLDAMHQHLETIEEELISKIERTNGYNVTKFVSECFIQQARFLGYPACIYRPGMIGSDSISGTSNMTDWINRLILGCFQMGYYPKTNVQLDILPVDLVSKIIVSHSQLEKAFRREQDYSYIFEIFQLVNNPQNQLNLDDLLSVCANLESHLSGKTMECVNFSRWKQILNQCAKQDDSLLRLSTLFKSEEFRISSNNETIGEAFFNFKIDEEYLKKQAMFIKNRSRCEDF